MVDPGRRAEVKEVFGGVLGPSIRPKSRKEAVLRGAPSGNVLLLRTSAELDAEPKASSSSSFPFR